MARVFITQNSSDLNGEFDDLTAEVWTNNMASLLATDVILRRDLDTYIKAMHEDGASVVFGKAHVWRRVHGKGE